MPNDRSNMQDMPNEQQDPTREQPGAGQDPQRDAQRQGQDPQRQGQKEQQDPQQDPQRRGMPDDANEGGGRIGKGRGPDEDLGQ